MSVVHTHSYAMHPTPRRLYAQARIAMLAFICLVSLLVFSRVTGLLSFVICACALIVPAVFFLFARHTMVVDAHKELVRRELWWGEQVRVWSHEYPFQKFDSVTIRRIARARGYGQRFRVYLTQRAGNRLLVRVFDAGIHDPNGAGRHAGELARRLSEDMHLPVVEPPFVPAK